MTSASVGFFSSFRSSLSVKFSSGSTRRSTSNRTRTFTSHAPLELAGMEVIRHERREIGTDVDEEGGLVAGCSKVERVGARDQLRCKTVDRIFALACPANGRGDDGAAVALHEPR